MIDYHILSNLTSRLSCRRLEALMITILHLGNSSSFISHWIMLVKMFYHVASSSFISSMQSQLGYYTTFVQGAPNPQTNVLFKGGTMGCGNESLCLMWLSKMIWFFHMWIHNVQFLICKLHVIITPMVYMYYGLFRLCTNLR